MLSSPDTSANSMITTRLWLSHGGSPQSSLIHRREGLTVEHSLQFLPRAFGRKSSSALLLLLHLALHFLKLEVTLVAPLEAIKMASILQLSVSLELSLCERVEKN